MADEVVEEKALPSSTSSAPKILLVVVLALVSSAMGGASTWFLISKTMGVAAKAQTPEKPAKDEREEVREMLEKGAIVPLDPFVVNLADADVPRYLRITIRLMVDDKTKIEEVANNQTRLAKIRDVILQTLTQKTSQSLVNEEGKNQLRREIFEKVEGFFGKPKLVDVMFTEFVIQL